jgi:hypothetical protein
MGRRLLRALRALVLLPALGLAVALVAPCAAVAEQQNAVPARFQGEWAASLAQCGKDSESRLVIGAAQIRFYESEGTIKAVVTRGERELALIAELSGEGETWLDFSHFRLSADQKTLTDITGERAFVRHRC